MVKITRYDFDGEQLTAGQISKRYPAYSPSTVALACEAGCKTLADLQARDRQCRANIAAANRENAKRMPKLCASPSGYRRNTHKRDLNSMGLRS